MGTAAWAKTKARVRKAMQDMTEELLKLYAQRKTAQGHSFPADNEWMREFEDAFEYSETEDQATAIADVKRDMEPTLLMDRLSAETGYGKTEAAKRVASKPTTIISRLRRWPLRVCWVFQHYETQAEVASVSKRLNDQPLPFQAAENPSGKGQGGFDRGRLPSKDVGPPT
jgi:transcription-repair coupling factor (superfamily II helicase)